MGVAVYKCIIKGLEVAHTQAKTRAVIKHTDTFLVSSVHNLSINEQD